MSDAPNTPIELAPVDAEAMTDEFISGLQLTAQMPMSQSMAASLCFAAVHALHLVSTPDPMKELLQVFVTDCQRDGGFGEQTQLLMAHQMHALRELARPKIIVPPGRGS